MRVIRNLAVLLILSAGVANAEEITIAALGDSLTQGYGLAPADGFVPQLQSWLTNRGHAADLINAGVSGDTTAGGLARIEWTLTDDVDGLIVALGGNDILRGLDPVQSGNNLRGILEVARAKNIDVLLVGMKAPPNYGAEYKAAFDAIYPELAIEYGAILHSNFLQALTADVDIQRALKTYIQPDGIHPNAMGVSLIVEDIGPSVLRLIERVDN